MLHDLFARIDGQREALVELTRELVQFPTVNPPGEAYKPCVRHLGHRLSRAGFDVSYIRAEGAIGDSERYPRVNMIARYQGRRPGPCVHFNGHIDVVEAGRGWTFDPFAGVVEGGRHRSPSQSAAAGQPAPARAAGSASTRDRPAGPGRVGRGCPG
jgi:succinyl-diaminopimelate desuccinylase